jgi:hypothetical protein
MTTELSTFQSTLESFGLGLGWTWSNGSWWLNAETFDPRATTAQMLALKARFVAITATERPDGEIRLDYQWDLSGHLLSFTAATSGKSIATIADLTPAADWVERETHEYFAVEFTGRATTLPLMMRAGDSLGINLRKEVQQ